MDGVANRCLNFRDDHSPKRAAALSIQAEVGGENLDEWITNEGVGHRFITASKKILTDYIL